MPPLPSFANKQQDVGSFAVDCKVGPRGTWAVGFWLVEDDLKVHPKYLYRPGLLNPQPMCQIQPAESCNLACGAPHGSGNGQQGIGGN